MVTAVTTHDSDCWHDFIFRVDLRPPPNSDWRTWIDVFILDTFVRESISAAMPTRFPWLIHRRWSPDDAGHELKFSCFCSTRLAAALKSAIKDHTAFPLYEKELATFTTKERFELEAASVTFARGENWWPVEIRGPWTTFVCGVSQALLQLLEEFRASEQGPKPLPDWNNAESVETYYRQIETLIAMLWQRHGQGVFLHHLNALFGGVPIIYGPPSDGAMLLTF